MANQLQKDAATYLAANSRWRIKRITSKAVILHCTDPGLRIHVGEKQLWQQRRVIGKSGTVWVDQAPLKLTTQQMAERLRRRQQASAS